MTRCYEKLFAISVCYKKMESAHTEHTEQTEQQVKGHVTSSKVKAMFNALKSPEKEKAKVETPVGEKEKHTPKSLSSTCASWMCSFIDRKVRELFSHYQFFGEDGKLQHASLFEQHLGQLVPK